MMALLKGMMIGFAFVAPIGMQNLYVFNNALSNKLRRALLYVVFVWFFDALFSFAAFFGMGALISANQLLKLVVMIIGGALVTYIGVGIVRSANNVQLNTQQNGLTIRKAITTAIIVSWANPQALIDGSLMLGALRGTLAPAAVWPFIIGVVTATAIWFTFITVSMNLLKDRLPKKVLVWVNLLSGMIVVGYGVYLLFEAVMSLI